MASWWVRIYFPWPELTGTSEKQRLYDIKETKRKLEDAKYQLEVALRLGNFERASQLRFSEIPELEKQVPRDNGDDNADNTMLHERVTSADIARVVAKATGL